MKLVLKKDEDGIWKIVHAKEIAAAAEQAKLAAPAPAPAPAPAAAPPAVSQAPAVAPPVQVPPFPSPAPSSLGQPARMPLLSPIYTMAPPPSAADASTAGYQAEVSLPRADARLSPEPRLGPSVGPECQPEEPRPEREEKPYEVQIGLVMPSNGVKPPSPTMATRSDMTQVNGQDLKPPSPTVTKVGGSTTPRQRPSRPSLGPKTGASNRGVSPSSPSANRSRLTQSASGTAASGRGASPRTATSARGTTQSASGAAAARPARTSSARAPSPGSPSSKPRRSAAAAGTEAPQAAAPNVGSSRTEREAQKLKELIRGVYQRKNRKMLGEVDALLEKHRGDEKGIYEYVCKKYGETPRPWSAKAQ